MVRYRRNVVPGRTYFFTVALADRRAAELVYHVDILREAVRKEICKRPFEIDAIVILPEHLHAILTLPEAGTDSALVWRRIKTVFTQGVIQTGAALPGRDGKGWMLWQRRFWEHTIRDDADYARHVDYIHYNPVKHGLVHNPVDWPSSSLHRFVRRGILAADWGSGGEIEGVFGEP